MSVALVSPTERPRIEPRIEPRIKIRIAVQRGSTVSGAADPPPSWTSGPRSVRSTFVDPLRIRVIPLSSTEQSWIAEIDHHTAGCVSLGDAGTGIAELRLVVVEFEYRGLGLGRRLVHEALAFADRMRYRAVQIKLDGAAPGAASWLTSLGFVAEECASSGEGPSGGGLPSSVQYRIDLASA